ncbi:MAG: deoxyribodipyrimidine photo-lyase, partial [Mangrovicoccus sp.]
MSETRPVIWWLRRDLRLSDNPCLQAALATGQPVIPVVILDPLTEAQGAAPLWRWGLGLGHFTQSLDQIGGRLIFRRGEALAELQKLIAETGATTVMWSRLYAPDVNARDAEVKTALKEADITAQSHPGHLLFEPWTVKPKSSPFYKVYTPMWKAVRDIP